MARILTPEQFRKCDKGTVFAFGGEWQFGSLMILDRIIQPYESGGWGFYALDPMWVDVNDEGDASDTLHHMLCTGDSRPAETASTKYMSYDGYQMDLFIVLEKYDWDMMRKIVEPAFR